MTSGGGIICSSRRAGTCSTVAEWRSPPRGNWGDKRRWRSIMCVLLLSWGCGGGRATLSQGSLAKRLNLSDLEPARARGGPPSEESGTYRGHLLLGGAGLRGARGGGPSGAATDQIRRGVSAYVSCRLQLSHTIRAVEIRAIGLTVAHGQQTVLRNINIHLPSGSSGAIVGVSAQGRRISRPRGSGTDLGGRGSNLGAINPLSYTVKDPYRSSSRKHASGHT